MNWNWIRKFVWPGLLVLLPGCAAPASLADLSTKTKKLGNQVSDSLTMKPKVIPADDPVKLASPPRQVPAAFYTQAAWCAEQQGNLTAAATQYAPALHIAPQDVTTLLSYARFLDRTGRPEAAWRIYQRAQTAAPRDALVWNDLGLFHARRGAWQSSVQALQQAVALQPQNLRYHNNLAAILIETQRPEEAQRELEKVYPPALAQYHAGCLLQMHHQDELAATCFTQALRLDPALSDAHRMLAQLQLVDRSAPSAVRLPAPADPASERVAEKPTRLPQATAESPVRF